MNNVHPSDGANAATEQSLRAYVDDCVRMMIDNMVTRDVITLELGETDYQGVKVPLKVRLTIQLGRVSFDEATVAMRNNP